MIKSVTIGEQIIITAQNKVGLMADVAMMLANEGINIESAAGYEIDNIAKLLLVTKANLRIIDALRKKKKYVSVNEAEVLIVDLENKPGALKVVTTELAENNIDIKYLYITPPSGGAGSAKMVLQTSDNEAAMVLLNKYVPRGEGRTL